MTQEIKTRIKQIQNSQVPDGYKKTNLGTVPNGWEQCLLSDLVTLKNGINADISKFGKGVKLISVSDILSPKPVMYDSITASIDISEELLDTYSVDYGDIIFQRSSENYKDAGTSNVYLDTKRATFGGFVIRGKKKADYHPQFLNLFLKSFGARKNIIRLAAGSQHVNISQDSLSKLQLHLPPLPEQEKIAEILTIQDTIIELKEKRIVEKEKQKKYLMQNLLTGKKRLAGFSGEWKKVRLGEICSITTGKLDANAMVENGRFAFFTCAREKYLIDEYAFDTEAILISGNGANVGYVHYYKGKFNAYQRTYILDAFHDNIFYIKFYLDSYLALRISKEKNEGNTPYITLPTLSGMKINLPSLPEQNAIAEILSTADKEIELLKKDLDAEKEKKKSLMQLLLTGIVRV